MSVMGWHFLQHACAYVAHHTRPTGHGCRDEAIASLQLYSTEQRQVRRQPLDSARGAENTRAPETSKETLR